VRGLDLLPRRQIEYSGTTIGEFDFDAALARHPQLILVDELAHTNAPGARHPKCWQDVEELLEASIDVYTTVNVQHIESLNDVVAQITGVIVRETVPDRVVEWADEVELIDLTTDDLLQRLKEGKVYLPQQAERAVQNFFRKGNLIALRELALRRTADRVDAQMQHYRQNHAIAQTWPTNERLLVGVSPARLARGWCAPPGTWLRQCAPNGSSWRLRRPKPCACPSRSANSLYRHYAWSSWAPRPSPLAGSAPATRSWITRAHAM
jgi:two-component system sensor histidine kinase KdpD